MAARDLVAVLLVVVIWGVNFVVIKIALVEIPPVLLSALRFFLAAVPAVFFIARPLVPFRKIAAYGFIMLGLQFALLFGGMKLGMPAGLASLALQVHVFVTIALAVAISGERPSGAQILGALIAFSGVVVIALQSGGEATRLGLTLVLLAATAWGIGNMLAKNIGKVDPLALIVWGSLVACGPLAILSWLLEGPALIESSLRGISLAGAGALAYIVYPTTLLGFAIWNWLLRRHPAATVAPFTLLVPVVGFSSAALFLNEPLQSWKFLAAVLVMAGLVINVFGPRWSKRVLL
jgi:O-acetylserine/cysteine efflux transporter